MVDSGNGLGTKLAPSHNILVKKSPSIGKKQLQLQNILLEKL